MIFALTGSIRTHPIVIWIRGKPAQDQANAMVRPRLVQIGSAAATADFGEITCRHEMDDGRDQLLPAVSAEE